MQRQGKWITGFLFCGNLGCPHDDEHSSRMTAIRDAWYLENVDCLVAVCAYLAGLSRWNELRNLVVSEGSGWLLAQRTDTE